MLLLILLGHSLVNFDLVRYLADTRLEVKVM